MPSGDIVDTLNQNWLGTMLGAVSIIVACIFAFFIRARPRLATQVNTLQLVGPNPVLPDPIEFSFRGTKVPTVTLSRVAIWNSGNTTIRFDQVVSADPLRIATSDGSSILETVILKRTRKFNAVECTIRPGQPNEVECRFDYLEPNDGALVQLIHTGSDNVQVRGTLRGLPRGVTVVGAPTKAKPQEQAQLSPTAARVLGFLCVSGGLLVSLLRLAGPLRQDPKAAGLETLGAILAGVGVIVLWVSGRIPPRQLGTQITSNQAAATFFWQRWFK